MTTTTATGATTTATTTTTTSASAATTTAAAATTVATTTSTTAAPVETTTTATTTTTPTATDPPATDPPVTDPAATDLPDTPGTAVIGQAYDFGGGVPDPADLPAQPGEVTARWYRAGDVLAVVYDGLPPEAPACPGNSAQTTAGFDYVSNSPTPGGSCGDFQTAIESNATQGVQICGGRVSYLTLIPSWYGAVLYASIERPLDGGGGVGVTGVVLVEDPATLPEIDPAVLNC